MRGSPQIGAAPGIAGPLGFAGADRFARNITGDSRIFYVDPNNTLSRDTQPGEDPQFPLLTVQQAHDNCRSYRGDTIYVAANGAWQYAEGVTRPLSIVEDVTITKHGIAIVGGQIGGAGGAVGVPWEPATALGTCLTIHGIDVVVDGFAFVGSNDGGDGIYAEWDGVDMYADNLTVRNCSFDDAIDVAIQLEFAWYVHVYNCFFQECDVQGLYVDPAGSGIAYSKFWNNWFLDCAAAMALRGAADNLIASNYIFNGNAQGAAAATDEGLDTTGGGNNLVVNNYFSCLLPVPANGDWDDLNTGAATDSWVGNLCSNGMAVTLPT